MIVANPEGNAPPERTPLSNCFIKDLMYTNCITDKLYQCLPVSNIMKQIGLLTANLIFVLHPISG